MLTDTLKLRLSSLRGRQPLPAEPRVVRGPPPRFPSDLADCFPDGGVCQTPRGEIFACDASLRELHSDASRLIDAYRGVFERAGRAEEESPLSHLHLLRESSPETTLLIDTETAGFHGRPLFLIGLVRWERDDLVLTQCFARDYAQEAALLSRLVELLSGVELLVSFNGKAFDWPFIRDRMVYHRLRCQASFTHLDLLHPSRRRWRSQLPNCQLKTLERHLCGRWRSGDIPSHEIPGRYHDFVREQDARVIAPVFHHNRLDLVTMVELLIALTGSEQYRVYSPV